jgi:hypothetical protein
MLHALSACYWHSCPALRLLPLLQPCCLGMLMIPHISRFDKLLLVVEAARLHPPVNTVDAGTAVRMGACPCCCVIGCLHQAYLSFDSRPGPYRRHLLCRYCCWTCPVPLRGVWEAECNDVLGSH